MKSMIIAFALLFAACSGGGRAAPAPTTGSQVTPTSGRTTTTVRPRPRSPLSARVILTSRTMPAGSELRGEVIVQNHTGHALHPTGCLRLFQIALSRGTFHQSPASLTCLQVFTIPVGRSTYPVTVTASYLACSPGHPAGNLRACSKTNEPPPLPPGEYRATLSPEQIVPMPPAVAVRITPPAH